MVNLRILRFGQMVRALHPNALPLRGIISIGCCLLLLLSFPAAAQEEEALKNPYFTPKVFPNAPNTAELGKYGDYTVSLFHGLPNISIPLYEVRAGEFTLPITLNYHASGIKVTDKASWAGLGWSVHAGGAVTRKVMGNTDESVYGYLSGKLKLASEINPETQEGFDYLVAVKNGDFDTQPDIFSYSFPGKSGKFFFNGTDNYKIEMVPFSPIKITKALDSNNKLSFNILDEGGNLFSFGKQSKESTSSESGGVTVPSVHSAWMLEEMISQNRRDTVSFSYVPAPGIIFSSVEDMFVVGDKIEWQTQSNSSAVASYVSSLRTVSASVVEQKLHEISYKNGKVVFVQSPETREDVSSPSMKRLEAIEVYSYDAGSSSLRLNKKIKFHHSYFTSSTNPLNKRLRLDSLLITDGTGEAIQRYRFEYNEAIDMPVHSSWAKDYWGYYNGKPNTSLVPKMVIDFIPGVEGPGNPQTITIGTSEENGRDSDSTFMQALILKRIHYPTGGYTDFEFETNRYYDQGENAVKLAGGLRVRSIRSYDGISPVPLVKTYAYTSAKKNFILSNYYFKTEQTYYNWGHMNSGGATIDYSKRIRTFLPNPTIDIVPFDASPVIYPTVTEYFGDGTKNTGKVEHVFYDQTDAVNATQQVRPVNDSYFFRRGHLKRKTTLARSDSGYQVVRQDSSSYFAFPQKSLYNVGLLVGKRSVNGGNGMSPDLGPNSLNTNGDEFKWEVINYSIVSGDQYPTGTSVTTYGLGGGGTPVTVSTSYAYDNMEHQQPTRVTTTDSNGKVQVVTGKYPADFRPEGSSSTGSDVLDTMLARNMQVSLIERWETAQDDDTGTRVTGGQFNGYKTAAQGAVVLDSQKRLGVDRPLGDFTPSGVVAGAVQADTRYGQKIGYTYDGQNNIQTVQKEDGTPVSYLWGYKNSLPIAQVLPASLVAAEETETKEMPLIQTLNQSVGTETQLGELTLDRDQTISLSYSVTRWGGVQDVMFWLEVKDAAGNVRGAWGFYNQPGTASLALPAGSYTFSYTGSLYPEPSPSSSGAAVVSLDVSYQVTASRQNLFHTSFEEGGTEGSGAKTGRLVHRGYFSLPLPSEPGQYRLTYWKRPLGGGEWELVEQGVEVTNTGAASVGIGDSNTEVDEVRLHPLEAQMTTYTYDPHIGMTSSTDPNNRTTYYQYDDFGRLEAVKDEEGNVLQSHEYHYAGQ